MLNKMPRKCKHILAVGDGWLVFQVTEGLLSCPHPFGVFNLPEDSEGAFLHSGTSRTLWSAQVRSVLEFSELRILWNTFLYLCFFSSFFFFIFFTARILFCFLILESR